MFIYTLQSAWSHTFVKYLTMTMTKSTLATARRAVGLVAEILLTDVLTGRAPIKSLGYHHQGVSTGKLGPWGITIFSPPMTHKLTSENWRRATFLSLDINTFYLLYSQQPLKGRMGKTMEGTSGKLYVDDWMLTTRLTITTYLISSNCKECTVLLIFLKHWVLTHK